MRRSPSHKGRRLQNKNLVRQVFKQTRGIADSGAVAPEAERAPHWRRFLWGDAGREGGGTHTHRGKGAEVHWGAAQSPRL